MKIKFIIKAQMVSAQQFSVNFNMLNYWDKLRHKKNNFRRKFSARWGIVSPSRTGVGVARSDSSLIPSIGSAERSIRTGSNSRCTQRKLLLLEFSTCGFRMRYAKLLQRDTNCRNDDDLISSQE